MIKNIQMLREEYSNYLNPDMKVKNLVHKGEYISIKQGLYVTKEFTNGIYLSPILYGPSYLSFEFALSYYQLIPELVYQYTNATFKTGKKKRFENHFGVYTYRDVAKEAYCYGIDLIVDDQCSYIIATPEKALCDMLYKISPLHNQKNLKDYLFNDLRIDIDDFYGLDLTDLAKLCMLYKTKNHKLLYSFIKKGIKNG